MNPETKTNGLQVKCSECDGKGYKLKLDIMSAKQTKEVCPKCNGMKIEEPKEYIKSYIPNAQIVVNQFIRDKNVLGTVEMWLYHIPGATMKNKNGQIIPCLRAEIHKMNTKSKYRRQGIARKILTTFIESHPILWITTDYNSSSEAGRKLLMDKFKFVQEGDNLLWERGEQKNDKIKIRDIRQKYYGRPANNRENDGSVFTDSGEKESNS